MATTSNQIITANRSDLSAFIRNQEGCVRNKILEQVDRMLIKECIAEYGNNQTKIAEVLGVNRGTLRTRMSNLGLINK